MNKIIWSTIILVTTFVLACGQTNQRGHSSLDKDYYVDGFRVYKNLSQNDSSKILKDIVTKINGDWTTTEKFIPTESAMTYTWTFRLNDTTFKGTVLNPDIIMAAHFVRLEIVKGKVKIIYSRAIGQFFVDENIENINVGDNELLIGDTKYSRHTDK